MVFTVLMNLIYKVVADPLHFILPFSLIFFNHLFGFELRNSQLLLPCREVRLSLWLANAALVILTVVKFVGISRQGRNVSLVRVVVDHCFLNRVQDRGRL